MAKRDGSMPDWPALMQRATAAKYCDMTPSEFEREVALGNLPMPRTEFCSAPRWSRNEIDAVLERGGNGGTPDWRQGSNLYA